MHIIAKISAATALAAATAAATLIAATAFASTASANPFEELFGQHRPTVQAPAYQSQEADAVVDDRSQFRLLDDREANMVEFATLSLRYLRDAIGEAAR